MASERFDVMFPTGMIVQGNLYKPNTTDAEGKPLITKSGPNAGQPRVDYFFALAIPKGAEGHWAETPWGAIIWKAGHGRVQDAGKRPTFAWKIMDGDSPVPNTTGRAPREYEGFPGCWVVRLGGGFAPKVVRLEGQDVTPWLQADAVNPGDYVEVSARVSDNESVQQPGVYINHDYVCFRAYGPKRITQGVDPKSLGFGGTPLPPGASMTPPSGAAMPYAPPPQPSAPAPHMPPQPSAPAPHMPPQPSAPIAVQPNYGLLTPGMPPAPPQRQMLPAANGATYDQMLALGWTDATLVQHGMMVA